jgi:nitrite reductase/ring-hydroxylating ferredoxin subunit
MPHCNVDRVASLEDVKSRTLSKVTLGDAALVICVFDSKIVAFDASCPHKGGPLALGEIVQDRVLVSMAWIRIQPVDRKAGQDSLWFRIWEMA